MISFQAGETLYELATLDRYGESLVCAIHNGIYLILKDGVDVTAKTLHAASLSNMNLRLYVDKNASPYKIYIKHNLNVNVTPLSPHILINRQSSVDPSTLTEITLS